MTDDTQTSAPAEVEPVEAPEQQPGEAQEAQPVETGEEGQPQAGDQEPEARKGNGIQKRISELVRQRKEAEAEAARVKARLAEFEAQQQKDAGEAQKAPALADFESYDDYVVALAEYKAAETFRRQQKQASAKQQEILEQRRQAALAQEWQAKVAEARATLPDFDAVAFREDVVISDAVRDALLDSDMGARLAYHLGKNPDMAARLSVLPPVSVAREIGRLEATLASQPVTTPTKAPEPPKPVKGSASAEKDPDKMTDAEWFAWREKQLRSRK